MRHPPKAMKYITCRLMSFRPWQASRGPLGGLSRCHGGISLIPTIPAMSPLLLLFICSNSTTLWYFQSLVSSFSSFSFHLPLFSHHSHSSPNPPQPTPTPLSVHPLPPGSWSSSATSVPRSAATHCSAMIQIPHINTGISPRDYLSVACLPGRVLLCNLYGPVNRTGKEGIWRSFEAWLGPRMGTVWAFRHSQYFNSLWSWIWEVGVIAECFRQKLRLKPWQNDPLLPS